MWVLSDQEPEHREPALALAEALGWPYAEKELRFKAISRVLPGVRATRDGLDRARSAALVPPWPDLVIAAGRRPSRVARRIGKQTRGRTRVVQLGRSGGQSAAPFDIVVTCGHSDLPTDRRRIETAVPLISETPERLARARERAPGLFDGAPHPRVLLWVGGTTAHHRLDAGTARRMAAEVRAFAAAAGGSVFALTSRRTGPKATAALSMGLGESGQVEPWRPGRAEDRDLAYLAAADVVVVTGESDHLLAQAVATGKPVYVYPVPERRLDPALRLSRWVSARAHAGPLNRRRTVRPQRGFEYICARLIERGIILPPRDEDELRQTLIRTGAALPFGAPLETEGHVPFREAGEVASRVRSLLGWSAMPEAPSYSASPSTVSARSPAA